MSEIDIAQRLEKLERDNRRLKCFAVAALVLATAFATIYATRPVSDKITAREFDLVDSSGTLRAALRMQPPLSGPVDKALRSLNPGFEGQPSPELYMEAGFVKEEQAGIARTVLSANGLDMSAMGAGQFEVASLAQGALILKGDSPSITLSDDKYHHVIWKAP